MQYIVRTQENFARAGTGDGQNENLAVNGVLSCDLEWFGEADLAGQLVVVHVHFQGFDRCACEAHDLDVLKLQVNANR